MTHRRLTHALILSAALLIGAGPYVVRAAGRQANPPAMAMVDIQQVYAESEARKAAESKIAEYGRTLGRRFDEIAGMQFLTGAEIRDYHEAVNAAAPAEGEKQKAAAIKAEADKRATEAQTLANKKETELTPADRTRMRELNSMRQQQPQVLAQLRQLYQQMVNDEDAKQTRAGVAEVRGVVSKLAKDQGISHVFDAASMVYAPVDLTQAAIAKVKKK